MRSITFVLIAFALVATASAFPTISTSALEVSFTRSSSDKIILKIENLYSSPATAYGVRALQKTAQGYRSQALVVDTLYDGKETIAPSASRTVEMGSFRDGESIEVHVLAVIFADGTVNGDLAWIESIIESRRRTFRSIPAAIEMLNQAISQGTDRLVLIEQFRKWSETTTEEPRTVTVKDVSEVSLRGPFSIDRTVMGAANVGSQGYRSAQRVQTRTIKMLEKFHPAVPDASPLDLYREIAKTLQDWRTRLFESKPDI